MYIFLIISSGSFAQYNYYPYYTPDSTVCKHLADSCSKRVTLSFLVPDGVNSKYKKDFLSHKEGATKYVKGLIQYTSTSDTTIYPFLLSVYEKIASANNLSKNYSIVLSNWPMMNAVNVDGGVIIFYAPLLSRLKNESQVAAIMCHEIAHGELNHIQKGLKAKLDAYYDKEFQKELSKTIKEEFNIQSKINLLALKYTFTSRYHDRSLEKAADSLGYLMLSKTKYDTHEALSALAVLKDIDKAAFQNPIDYSSFFKCLPTNYDFANIQPYKKSSLFNVIEDKDPDSLVDSLRTHPDCVKRIAYVTDLMKTVPAHDGIGSDSIQFGKIRWAAAMEMIMAFHSYEYYDLSLFNAIQYLQQYPGNDFLKAMVELNWYGLYNSMKNHELADYISNYSDENPAALNNLLFLINNLRLPEMAEFGNCFASKNKVEQQEYAIVANYCTAILNDDKSSTSFQEEYKSRYKKGRFSELLQVDPKPDPKDKKKKH